MDRVRRAVVAGLGLAAFGLGCLGVFVPGLPTTIFWILAAAAFLRTNPKLYDYVVSRPRFGPAVRLFVEEGRIRRKGKLLSVAAMLGFAGLGAILAPPLWAKLLILGSALAGSAWVAALPLAEEEAVARPGSLARPGAAPRGAAPVAAARASVAGGESAGDLREAGPEAGRPEISAAS